VGATQKSVTQIYTTQILALGVVASLAGVLLGFAAHVLLIELLGAFAGVALPPPNIIPALGGLATGMVTLAAFSLPPLLQLQNVPALRVLRRDLGALRAPGWFAYTAGIAVLAALMVWQARDVKLGFYMTGGTVAAMVLLALIAWGLLLSLRLVRGQTKGSWLFGLSNLLRRRNASLLQIVAFGLGIMALLMLTIVRGDLLDEWAKTLPADAPNRFIINIQPGQAKEIETFFTSQGVAKPELYPMVRGRLVQVNHANTDATHFDGERAQRLIQRELNLTWTNELPAGNKVNDGKWWSAGDADKAWLSVEQGIAKTLGIKVGDSLTFKVGGDEFSAEVVSLREVNWDSFRANFFVIGTPGVLKSFPSTYMTSFYLAENRITLLNDLVNRFPNITVIDIAAIMTQVRDIINRVTLAVEYVFLFTLAAGVMVLFAGIQSTHDERMLENAIVRTLGGSRQQIVNALVSEFAILGILAGVLASVLATVLAYVIADSVLNMPFYFSGWMWIYGVAGGGVGVALAGYLGSRSVVNRPPLQTLRRVT
jgi:putative ABC transport system permease protein